MTLATEVVIALGVLLVSGAVHYALVQYYVRRGVHTHKPTVVLFFIPVCVFFPIVEELLFRSPLVFLFDELSAWSVGGVILSAILFGVLHPVADSRSELQWWSARVSFGKLVEGTELGLEIKQALERRAKRQWVLYVRRTAAATSIGLLAGVCAVWTQSLWAAIAIHAGWNTFWFSSR